MVNPKLGFGLVFMLIVVPVSKVGTFGTSLYHNTVHKQGKLQSN